MQCAMNDPAMTDKAQSMVTIITSPPYTLQAGDVEIAIRSRPYRWSKSRPN